MSERDGGLSINVARPRCPYCHDSIAKGQKVDVCSECHALHHRRCFRELKKCATCGQIAPAAKRAAIRYGIQLPSALTKQPPPPRDAVPTGPTVRFEAVQGVAGSPSLLDRAARVATEVGRERLIAITQAGQGDNGSIIVWFWEG